MIKKLTLFTLSIFFVCCSNSLHKNKFIISGTYLEVISSQPQAAKIVLDEFKRLDKIFNIYDPDSELSRLNKTHGKRVKCSKDLMNVLELSDVVYNLSDGAFDVSYGAIYGFWKEWIKDKKTKNFPSAETIKELKTMCGRDNFEINYQDSTVLIKNKGTKIDLSGIAKGYMVDMAAKRLKEAGISSALINAGGDIYCMGKNNTKSWKAGIRDPQYLKGVIESQELVDEAIATSGGYEQFYKFEEKTFSHLIDPRTGLPVQNSILSVSVISKNCTTADSLATAFYILGIDRIKDFFSRNPSTMRVFVVVSEGKSSRVYMFR